jgi:hypothetical protein
MEDQLQQEMNVYEVYPYVVATLFQWFL